MKGMLYVLDCMLQSSVVFQKHTLPGIEIVFFYYYYFYLYIYIYIYIYIYKRVLLQCD